MWKTSSGTEIRMLKRGVMPKNPTECQLVPGGYAPRPRGAHSPAPKTFNSIMEFIN